MTADHRREFLAVGLGLICDLRSQMERGPDGHDWAPAERVLHAETADDFGSIDGCFAEPLSARGVRV